MSVTIERLPSLSIEQPTRWPCRVMESFTPVVNARSEGVYLKGTPAMIGVIFRFFSTRIPIAKQLIVKSCSVNLIRLIGHCVRWLFLLSWGKLLVDFYGFIWKWIVARSRCISKKMSNVEHWEQRLRTMTTENNNWEQRLRTTTKTETEVCYHHFMVHGVHRVVLVLQRLRTTTNTETEVFYHHFMVYIVVVPVLCLHVKVVW